MQKSETPAKREAPPSPKDLWQETRLVLGDALEERGLLPEGIGSREPERLLRHLNLYQVRKHLWWSTDETVKSLAAAAERAWNSWDVQAVIREHVPAEVWQAYRQEVMRRGSPLKVLFADGTPEWADGIPVPVLKEKRKPEEPLNLSGRPPIEATSAVTRVDWCWDSLPPMVDEGRWDSNEGFQLILRLLWRLHRLELTEHYRLGFSGGNKAYLRGKAEAENRHRYRYGQWLRGCASGLIELTRGHWWLKSTAGPAPRHALVPSLPSSRARVPIAGATHPSYWEQFSYRPLNRSAWEEAEVLKHRIETLVQDFAKAWNSESMTPEYVVWRAAYKAKKKRRASRLRLIQEMLRKADAEPKTPSPYKSDEMAPIYGFVALMAQIGVNLEVWPGALTTYNGDIYRLCADDAINRAMRPWFERTKQFILNVDTDNL